ncbi:unnamed protein product [Phytophthora fragariaefolia]|uniref:Unnamed protein product n=1 Tax=Phytophthora fragariaefolia TaxID=1490495 RepID=A0A9W6XH89_9STRA|nr:unnamed protein product [Phytophthora fragariaefolia]
MDSQCWCEKIRITVMLLGDMHGNRKTPFAVFKQPGSKDAERGAFNHEKQNDFERGFWPKVAPLMDKHDVQIYCNTKGWWNARLSILFLRYHFGLRDSLGEKIRLLWDDFSGHWTEDVRMYAVYINVVLMKIPPDYTFSCQLADIARMKPFKLELRSLWVEHLQQQLRNHKDVARKRSLSWRRRLEQFLSHGSRTHGKTCLVQRWQVDLGT